MSRARRRLIGAVLLAVLVAACDEFGLLIPTGPSGESLDGSWMGWFTSVSAGTRTATATLFQTGSVVGGIWTIFDTDGSISGDLFGSVVGSTAVLTLRPTSSDGCSMSIVATVTRTTLEGTWSSADCDTRDTGTFRLFRLTR